MIIHTNDADSLFFHMSYNAKRMLDDSIERTPNGYNSICEGKFLSGSANILLARIESIVATLFVAISGTLVIGTQLALTAILLPPIIVLNLASRLPLISSFQSVQEFTHSTNDLISRALKTNLITIPIVFLFLSASTINVFLPGVLTSENIFFRAIHRLTDPLGPLLTIRATVPGNSSIVGTPTELHAFEISEEYLRALSSQNYLKEKEYKILNHIHTYSR